MTSAFSGVGKQAARVVLVGNPNVGKSVIFGALTGRYVNVSNYPGTTVEVTRGEARDRGSTYEIIDTPGAYSLIPMSEDERVTRDILMLESEAYVLQVCDARNMRRSLMITVQLAEMEVPFVMAVNMMDEVRSKKSMPNLDILEEKLGVRVIPTVAVRKQGTDRLLSLLEQAAPSIASISYGVRIEEAIERMKELLPDKTPIGKRALALMLLCGDDSLTPWLAGNVPAHQIREMNAQRSRLVETTGEDILYRVNQARLMWIDQLFETEDAEEPKPEKADLAARFGWLSMDPVYGIPILAVVLFIAYLFVGVFGAGVLVDLFKNIFFDGYVVPAATWVIDRVFPWPFLKDFLVGPYGMISMGFSYAIAIVLPIVGTFFLGFGTLEDSGYLPRLSVMVDRVFRKIGCNGKAVLPMILGFGCVTMATLTTRILETKRERIIVTLLLALGIPCSAQLGVIMGMLADIGIKASVVWFLLLLGVFFLVGYLAGKVIPGESSDFIMEVPPIRLPRPGNLLVKTMARIEWYMREAVPLFLLGTLILFVADRLEILLWVQRVSEPVVVKLLDLPPKTSEAFMIGFLRRDYGAAGLFAMAREGMLTNLQVMVSLVTITLFIPCLANLLVIYKEHGGRVTACMVLFIFPFAILVGAVVNFVARLFGVTF
ncbi:MAG: ferrous iron transport protein B [Syntrophorhabdaceae bacterium]|nr:ferrous iron transport protein B [Syntrophorhabdaceae bacterium]